MGLNYLFSIKIRVIVSYNCITKEAQSDNPKLGFLKMRLSLLKVRNLYLEIDLRHTSPDRLMGLFTEVSQKRGFALPRLNRSIFDLLDCNRRKSRFKLTKESSVPMVLLSFGIMLFTKTRKVKKYRQTFTFNKYSKKAIFSQFPQQFRFFTPIPLKC